MNAFWFSFGIREKYRPVPATKDPVMPAFSRQGQEASGTGTGKDKEREGLWP